MRIIHTSDLHLDSRIKTNLDPVKAKERKRELLSSFEKLIAYAKNNGVDAVLISGDLFDRPKSSARTRDYILNLIENVPEIDFLLIYGHHDDNVFNDLVLPKNLYIFKNLWDQKVYPAVTITGISGDQLPRSVFDSLSLDESKLNIVMMHGDVTQSSSIPLSCLQNRGIDYLALGHIHKYKKGKLDERGVYVYPGCLEGRGFEEDGPKGFVLIDVKEKSVESHFVPFAKRVLHNVDIDISGCDNWSDVRKLVDLKLSDIQSQDMVKIIFRGGYDLDLIKQADGLEQNLNQQYYYAEVEDVSRLRINPKDYENDISLKGEFIRNVLSSKMSEDDKIRVIEYGIKALMKEDI